MSDIAFWVIVGITVGSSFMVVQSKSLLYSAYALLFTFIGVTGLYIFLLIIFGIMLTNKITSVNISHTSMQKSMGAVVVIAFMGLLGYMILSTPWLVLSNAEPSDTTSAIGRLLLMDYLLPFEAVSLLLLGALIGATTLSRKDT